MAAEDHHQEVTLEAEVEETTKRRTTTTARTIATTRTMLMPTMGTPHPKAKLNIQSKISKAEKKTWKAFAMMPPCQIKHLFAC